MREICQQRLIKYIWIIALAMFVLARPQVVQATEYVPQSDEAVTYDEQPIDNFSGEIIEEGAEQTTGKVRITSNCVYDRATQMFVYAIDNTSGREVSCSVADGMITNEAVTLSMNNRDGFALYKDGKELKKSEMESVSEKGVYVLLHDGRKVVEFTIAGEYSSFQSFSLPDGFSFVEVFQDGAEKWYQASQVNFKEEGTYIVKYKCNYTGIMYSFTTTIDHTAPVLTLKGLDEDNKARGPVDISDVEEGGRVVVLLNGEEIRTSGTLTQNGPYTVTVYDEAGNSTTYNFLIMLYFNVSGIGFLLAVIGIAVGLGVYVLVSAKKFRVC